MGNIIPKEPSVKDSSYVNHALKYKLDKQLTPWETRNFLFWIVMDSENFNNVSLVVQSVYMNNFPTLVLNANNSNYEASLMNTITQYREYIKNIKTLDFDDRNVILNRWWKNYLFNLPKQPGFSDFSEKTITKE